MYSYTYDEATGGILLNSTPTVFSKEPRPVYAKEMDILGFDRFWEYDKQNEVPYMWAEATTYWYRGVAIAKIKGGDIYSKPLLIPTLDESEKVLYGRDYNQQLLPIDIRAMCEKNKELIAIMTDVSVKMIVKAYEKYRNKLDIFHVAFSGGKDSAVLLDLTKKSLPKGSFVVIFGDTGMEFPDTYEAVEIEKNKCEEEGIPFYVAKSHFAPEESWNLFGPPARVLRWCCSVHKSTPQTLKMREITGKNNYTGLDFVGVRAYESIARSKYEVESVGKKQKGQYSFNPILEWTSGEIWLYLFINNIHINAAYKNGNSRAGCLFCPMGGGKGDYMQYHSYPKELSKYIDLINSMNARNQGDEEALATYISKGGWNARKNGRDLTINYQRYSETVDNKRIVLSIIDPLSNWKEWIKTLGNLPFELEIVEKTNRVDFICDATVSKKYPKELRGLKYILHKSAHCVACKVCEVNCHRGCISFSSGKVIINDCVHCGQCHEIDDGCLAYHSLKTSKGEGKMKKGSINSFANHAPKPDWIQEFFDSGDAFWDGNSLNPNHQVPMFKKFLRDAGLIDSKNKTTELYDIGLQLGIRSNTLWGIIVSNFAYNPQFRWYIENMDVGIYYERNTISDKLIAEGVSKGDTNSIIGAFKRFCELPIGTSLNWGYVEEKGKIIDTLARLKCNIDDKRVLLYSLYKFAEQCNDYKEFHLSYLFDDTIEKDGISPVQIFGLYDEEEWKSILLGLSAAYPEFINATFTNDLKTITLREKTSADVLDLFKEEF